MAKNKRVENEVASEENKAVTAEETTVVETKASKKEEKAPKAKDVKKKKVSKDTAPKKSRIKETLGELKKVTWPSFGKAMKQTGMVLAIVLVFGVVVLGLDLLISFIINLLSSI